MPWTVAFHCSWSVKCQHGRVLGPLYDQMKIQAHLSGYWFQRDASIDPMDPPSPGLKQGCSRGRGKGEDIRSWPNPCLCSYNMKECEFCIIYLGRGELQ